MRIRLRRGREYVKDFVSNDNIEETKVKEKVVDENEFNIKLNRGRSINKSDVWKINKQNNTLPKEKIESVKHIDFAREYNTDYMKNPTDKNKENFNATSNFLKQDKVAVDMSFGVPDEIKPTKEDEKIKESIEKVDDDIYSAFGIHESDFNEKNDVKEELEDSLSESSNIEEDKYTDNMMKKYYVEYGDEEAGVEKIQKHNKFISDNY